MADLLINGQDALANFGVRMGDGFLDALGAPAPTKPYIENSSRLEHGKRVITTHAKVDYRQLTLEFTIQGTTQADFSAKKTAFYTLLYGGAITLSVPANGSEIYRLNYLGNSPTYGQSRNRCFCRVAVKFEEPNPMNRD